MAGMTDLGGLFVKLGLNLDKNSFETGNKAIDGMVENFSKLMGVARNTAVVLAGTAVATGTVESATYKTAQALGISTKSLDTWKAAAKIAGVNASGLVGSMSQLGSTLRHIQIDGRGLKEYSNKLQELGLGITDLQDKEGNWLKADAAYKKIVGKAQSDYSKAKTDEERQLVITKVGDVLGAEAQGLFSELVRQNITIDELLKKAESTIFTTAADNANGQNFLTEFNTLRDSIESLTKLFGDDVARELTPAIQGINKWIQEHGENMMSTLDKLATAIGNGVEKIAPAVEDGAEMAGALIDAAADAANGNTEQAKNTIDDALWSLNAKHNAPEGMSVEEWKKHNTVDRDNALNLLDQLVAEDSAKAKRLPGALGIFTEKKKYFSELSPETQAKIQELEQEYNFHYGHIHRMQDGIMRPDGTVTQVAPDDWVFAARNVGDLARAFIPPMPAMAGGNNEYVINQTFNINGSSDLPQVLRQQAYQGTHDGLMQIMEQSSQRLQLMSGTR